MVGASTASYGRSRVKIDTEAFGPKGSADFKKMQKVQDDLNEEVNRTVDSFKAERRALKEVNEGTKNLSKNTKKAQKELLAMGKGSKSLS